MIKILTFSLLYPNARQPRHGIFVEQRLRRLVESGEVRARVVAPVPWFPFTGNAFGRYGMYGSVPRREARHDISIIHPRFPAIPKIGMNVAPKLLVRAMAGVLRRIIANGYDFDLIDAHYFYPDGVAAVELGRALGKPVVVTCRGDDIMYFPRHPRPRRMILEAAREAAGIVTVSGDLKRRLCALGVPAEWVTVLRNGIDLGLFKPPTDRDAVRRSLGLARRTLLSVGHLIERKGHHLAIAALNNLPDTDLVIIGERGTEPGGMVDDLHRQVADHGLADRVRFVENVPQCRLRDWYGAADALVLATDREGMPNVVLESLGCGTPVIATPAGGIPEIMTVPEAGVMMDTRTASALVEAARVLFEHYPSREDTRRFAETLSWDATTRGQIALFRQAITAGNHAAERRSQMSAAMRNC